MRPFIFKIYLVVTVQAFVAAQAFSQDTNFVRVHTWDFENFRTPTDPWDLFRETYIGVAPSYSEASPFDKIMYDNIHTKMLNTGHCFGMSLMAIQLLRYGGYDGFCAPAGQYPHKIHPGNPNDFKEPADERLHHSLDIMQGHILNFRVVSHLLDLIAQNRNRDGNYAFGQYKYYEAKKEYSIMCITKGLANVSKSHALLPYFATDLGAGHKRIYVYDVNRPFNKPGPQGHDWYVNGENFIDINNGTWSFDMLDECLCSDCSVCYEGQADWSHTPAEICPCHWSGSSSAPLDGVGTGNIFTVPFSVIGNKDRLPQSIFADGLEAIGKIFIFSQTASLEQMSTPDGRHYLPNGNHSDTAALRSVLPHYPFNGTKTDGSECELYYVRGENDLDITLCAGENGFKVQFFSDYHSITVSSEKAFYDAQIRIRGWHSLHPVAELVGENSEARIDIQPLLQPGQ